MVPACPVPLLPSHSHAVMLCISWRTAPTPWPAIPRFKHWNRYCCFVRTRAHVTIPLNPKAQLRSSEDWRTRRLTNDIMRLKEKIMTKPRMISLNRSLNRTGKKKIDLYEWVLMGSVCMHIPLKASLSTYERGSEQEGEGRRETGTIKEEEKCGTR